MTPREKDIREVAKLYKGNRSSLDKITPANLTMGIGLSIKDINPEFIFFVLKMIVKYRPNIVKDITDYIKTHN